MKTDLSKLIEERSRTPDVTDLTDHFNLAFDPEARQRRQAELNEQKRADDDWEGFINTRPYLDEVGNVLGPDGQPMDVDTTDDGNEAHYDRIARETLSNTSREGLGVVALAQLAREARRNNNTTQLQDISDKIEDRLVEMESRYSWDTDTSTAHLDQVLGIIYGEDTPDDTPEPVRGDGPDDGMDDDNPKQNPNKSEGVLQPGKGAEADNFENHANGTGPAARPPASEKDEHGGPEPPKKSGSSAREHTQEQKDLIAKLKIARGEFIEAKVSVESSFFKKWFGGIRRHERLDAAREAVAALEAKVAKFQLQPEIDRIREDMEKNEKGADEERQAINSLMTLHVFKQIKDVENAAAQRYDQALEERSGLKKFMAKIGNFFVTGGKIGKWLKPMGAGFGVGAATGLFAMWPITTAVGIASSAFVGAASKQAALQERAGEKRIGDDEEQVIGWLEMLNAGVGAEDVDPRLREIAERAYGASTEDSRLRQDELRKRVRGAMGKYSVGFALGGLAGHYGSSLAHEYFGGEAEAVSGSGAEGSAGGEAEAVSGSGAEGSAGGERVTDFVDINTNIHGPEHALQDLLKLSPGQADALMAELQNTGFNMDNLFVDSFGGPVDITNYGGKIGHGFTTWNSNLSLELTVEAKKVLKALGYAL